jgi:hypothetical protein
MQLCHKSEELDPSDLRLHHKVVVLGGGKQAHMRGGDVRRIVIHADALYDEAVRSVYHRLANEHPVIGGRAAKIQAVFRGFMMRLLRTREIERNKQELLKEKEEEKKKKKEEDGGKGDDKDEKKEDEEKEDGKAGTSKVGEKGEVKEGETKEDISLESAKSDTKEEEKEGKN